MRRLPVLIVFGGLLAAGLIVDRNRPAPADVVYGTVSAPVQPVASPASATSTSWFCPGVPAPPDGSTAGFVTMANPTDEAVTATLTVVPSEGNVATRPVSLAAHTTTSVNLAEVAPAAFAAAQVDVHGGGVVVEQSVAKGPLRDPSACATAAASTWYLASGVTTRDATLKYFVYNPYPDDAIVDMDFATNDGRFAPQPLQGLVIRGGSMRVVDITDQVRRRTAVAGTITARSGRVVVGKIQTYDGSAGPEGFTSGIAAPATATQWLFPDGRRVPQVSERVVVYNPGPDPAEVDIEVRPVAPPEGADDAAPLDTAPLDTAPLDTAPVDTAPVDTGPLETAPVDTGPVDTAPLDDTGPSGDFSTIQSLSLPPYSQAAYDVTGDETVADGVHSIIVTSANGTPIVAERITNLVADTGTRGVSSMLGSRLTANRWLLAAGGTSSSVVEELTVLSDDASDTTVTLTAIDPKGNRTLGDPLTVPAGGFVQVRLNDLVQQSPLTVLVEGKAPIVVERGLIFKGQAETSRQLGVPLS
ncbi:MAG TPA: DUF5719 family protein [Acidimicrobiales bacterium]|nr:DUF5719 family protein [Acidimicrobiales bacterium]